MREFDWQRAAAVTVTLAGGILTVYLVLRYLLPLFLPFLIGFLLSLLTRPLVKRLSARTGCPERLAAVLLTLGALSLLVLCTVLLCSKLLAELQNLLEYLARDTANGEGELARLLASVRSFWERIPLLSGLLRLDFLRELLGEPEQYLANSLAEALSSLTRGLASLVGGLLRRLPGVLFFLLVTVIACFYFALDHEKVGAVLLRLLPRRIAARVPGWCERVKEGVRRCARAYFLLFLLTFGELTLGFLLLGVRYPFLLALLSATLDILPVLGVGTVLVPWALFLLFTGSLGRGIWLLVLYAVITVVRQITEPHLVGKSLGLHPLLMLMAFYVGLRVFGAAGLVLGPCTALLLKAVLWRRAAEQA